MSASDLPYWAVMFTTARVLSGSSPSPPLKDMVARVAPTPLLLISATSFGDEGRFNRMYAEVAREPFELWELHDVGHRNAVRARAAEYERRVVGFLDRALRPA